MMTTCDVLPVFLFPNPESRISAPLVACDHCGRFSGQAYVVRSGYRKGTPGETLVLGPVCAASEAQLALARS